MDLTNALELIQKTAQAAAAPKAPPRLETGDTTRLVYYDHTAADGPLVTFTVPPDARAHRVDDLETLAALAEGCTDPALWFCRTQIVLHFDAADRRELAVMPLQFSEPFQDLRQLADRDTWTQKGLIRFLRLRLGVDNPAMLDRFRRLDWTHTATTKAESRHQRESLGKEITAAVQGVEDIPDTLTVTVPVYDLPVLPCPQEVRLALEVDAGEQRFTLAAFPGQLAAAEAAAAEIVRERLAALVGDVPIYSGRP